nr:Crp/Fnr family transcriptional regulator [Candidatus Viadribacter manganicus]
MSIVANTEAPQERFVMSKEFEFDPKVFLAAANHTHAYSAGDVIFLQGDAADAVFYVHRGEIKIVVTSEEGKEAVVGILKSGEFFGEGCLVGQTLRLASAVALTDCSVTRTEKGDMVRALHAEPAFAELFMTYLLTRTSRVEADLADLLFNSSEKRLARALLLLSNLGKDGAPQVITTKVSQETLAAIVGTTRSRINHFMNKFRKLGFIEYNGSIHVHSSLLSVLLRD